MFVEGGKADLRAYPLDDATHTRKLNPGWSTILVDILFTDVWEGWRTAWRGNWRPLVVACTLSHVSVWHIVSSLSRSNCRHLVLSKRRRHAVG